MSIQVKMYVDDQAFNLKRFHFGFAQNTNHYGLPSSATKQKGFYGSTNMVKNTLFEEWAFADRMKKDVEIHMVHNVIGQGRTRILKCYDCFLVQFEVDYDTFSTEVATNHFVLMCGAMEASWSTTTFLENAWGKMPTKDEPVTVVEDDETPKIIRQYITDASENELQEYKQGDEILYIIESENFIGEEIKVDLHDKTVDFLYNGKRLKNDCIESYIIQNDIEKIPLQVIPEDHED